MGNCDDDNNNKGTFNLSFQYNKQTINTQSYDTYICPPYLSHSVGLHVDWFWATAVIWAWWTG